MGKSVKSAAKGGRRDVDATGAQAQQDAQSDERYLTFQEALGILGFSRMTFQRKRDSGEIAIGFKLTPRGRWCFTRAEVVRCKRDLERKARERMALQMTGKRQQATA